MRRIAKDMLCAKSSVQNAIKGLEKKGFIRLVGRRTNGFKSNNQYWVMHDIETVLNAFKDEDTRDYFYAYQDHMVDAFENYIVKYKYDVSVFNLL